MSDFVLYAKIDGDWAVSATFADKEAYTAAINRYFGMKKAEGKSLDDCDTVLALFTEACVVERKRFGLVKRALRHYDEIGISNDLVEAIDQAKRDGAEAVGWGTDAPAGISPHDFGDMEI
jgi:hypothetical protein